MEMEPWLQTLLTILGTILASSGFWAYIQERSKRKAAENKHNNLETQMLIGLAHDRIIYLGMTRTSTSILSSACFQSKSISSSVKGICSFLTVTISLIVSSLRLKVRE